MNFISLTECLKLHSFSGVSDSSIYVWSVTSFFTLTCGIQPLYLLTGHGLHSLACGCVLRSRWVSPLCKGLLKSNKIVVTNLNASVNADLKYYIPFSDSRRNRCQESKLRVPFSNTYMPYMNGYINIAFCNLNTYNYSVPSCPAFSCCWLASFLVCLFSFCLVPFFFLNVFYYYPVIKTLLNFPVVH